jgi:hypothetical protein
MDRAATGLFGVVLAVWTLLWVQFWRTLGWVDVRCTQWFYVLRRQSLSGE